MAKSRAKLRLKMAAIWLTQVARGELELKDYASLCGQLEKDASEDQQAHSSRQAARAAGDKQQGLKQLSRRTSEAAHGKTSAAARSSTEDATGAAPTAAAPPRDAPIVAALKTAKTESDVAQALDEAARTTAAATGMHAAPTKAAAEPKNCLVCAAAEPRRRQSRPRGRRGYGKRQWRRRQLEDSRNAGASAAKTKMEDRNVAVSAENKKKKVNGEAAAIAAVTMEGELEAENKAMLRRLKESIAELEGLVQATVSGADDGAVQHMARFNTGKSFARWRHVSKSRWAAAKQEFNAAQKMKRCKSRMVLARWRQAVGFIVEANVAARIAARAGEARVVRHWRQTVRRTARAEEVVRIEKRAVRRWEERMVKRYRRQPLRRWRNTAAQARQIGECQVQRHTEWKHSAGVERCSARADKRIAEMDGFMQEIQDRLGPAEAHELAEVTERARVAEREIVVKRGAVAAQCAAAEVVHRKVCDGQQKGVDVQKEIECREQEMKKLRKQEREHEEAKDRAVIMRQEWAEAVAMHEKATAAAAEGATTAERVAAVKRAAAAERAAAVAREAAAERAVPAGEERQGQASTAVLLLLLAAYCGWGMFAAVVLCAAIAMVRRGMAVRKSQEFDFIAAMWRPGKSRKVTVAEERVKRKLNARTMVKKWAAVVDSRQLVAHREEVKAIRVNWREVTAGLRALWKVYKDRDVKLKKVAKQGLAQERYENELKTDFDGKYSTLRAQADLLDAKLKEVGLE